jgi:hypothetical protein
MVIKLWRMRWLWHVAHIRDENVYNILVRKPVQKRPLRRPRCRWEDIRIDLGEKQWKVVDCIHLAQDRDQW